MKKSVLSILLTAGLVAGALAPLQAQAAPPPIPAKPNIEDPVSDANTRPGNVVTPADATSVGDLFKIWFSNTADTLSVHFYTEAQPPGTNTVMYEALTNPSDDVTGGCLRFAVLIPGTNASYQGDPHVKLVDRCNDKEGTDIFDNGVEGKMTIDAAPAVTSGTDGGITTITFPRAYSPLTKAAAATLIKPRALSRVVAGSDTKFPDNPAIGGRPLAFPVVDDTVVGTDYKFTAAKVAKKTPPPGKNSPPGKKKGCKKGKGKKKGCKKVAKPKPPAKPRAAACAAYKPGDAGKDAKTVVLTPTATEAKPVEVMLDLDPGFGQALGAPTDVVTTAAQSHAYYNVQVDSSLAEAGLFVRLASPLPSDNDLYLLHSTGVEAAHAAGFTSHINSNDDGGHTDDEAEYLDGIRTKDCYGYTVHAIGANSLGGATSLKLWLGAPSAYEVPPPSKSFLPDTLISLF